MVISLYLKEQIPFASQGHNSIKGENLVSGNEICLTGMLQITLRRKMAFSPNIMNYFLLSIL